MFVKYAFAILLLPLLLSACAGPEALEPKKLSNASKVEAVYVKKISLNKDQIGLDEGVYKSELQNNKGTFYRGPEGCFRLFGGHLEGGIFITNRTGEKIYRLYYYKTPNDSPAVRGHGLGEQMANYMATVNDGKIMLLQPINSVNYAELVSQKTDK